MGKENNRRDTIRDANILPGGFRNFQGKADRFTPPGVRSFHIALPEDVAKDMAENGYNVKYKEPREDDVDGREGLWFLKVAVSYDNFPPEIWRIQGNTKTLLSEDMLWLIDEAQIIKADIMLNLNYWENKTAGTEGYKTWLYKAFITVDTDELDAEYADYTIAT